MAWLWIIIGAILLGFAVGYATCYVELMRLARRLNESKPKRKRRSCKREGATAIGFAHDVDDDGMVAM